MASKEELRQRQNALLAVHDAAKAELMKIPGVLAVGIGLKEIGGKLSDQICFRVYVEAKKDAAELPAVEIIPAEVHGFPTDVLKVYEVRQTAQFVERQDLSEHRPLTGGVAISTKSETQKGSFYGTLGWFATKVSDNSTVVLTNKHVLWGDPPPLGVSTDTDKLSQPLWKKTCCCEYHVIGERIIGIKETAGVDCALGRLNADETPSLHIGNRATNVTLKVSDTDNAIVNFPVRKIGARSGYTEGVVIDIEGATKVEGIPAPDGTPIKYVTGRQIIIWPADTETYIHENGKPCFGNHGDSGAVVIDQHDKIVGLLWGNDPETPASRAISVANHISAVLKAFKDNNHEIKLHTSPVGNNAGLAGGPRLPPRRTLYDLVRESDTLLAELGRRHREEVAGLIDHCRPVMVAWHRHHGPAFAAAVNRSQREPAYRIPPEINGISRHELLVAMARALETHGSAELQEDLREHGLELLDDLCRAENVREILFPEAMEMAQSP